jgi:hypothetical protein
VIKENNGRAGVFARAFQMIEAAQLPRLLLLTAFQLLGSGAKMVPLIFY